MCVLSPFWTNVHVWMPPTGMEAYMYSEFCCVFFPNRKEFMGWSQSPVYIKYTDDKYIFLIWWLEDVTDPQHYHADSQRRCVCASTNPYQITFSKLLFLSVSPKILEWTRRKPHQSLAMAISGSLVCVCVQPALKSCFITACLPTCSIQINSIHPYLSSIGYN